MIDAPVEHRRSETAFPNRWTDLPVLPRDAAWLARAWVQAPEVRDAIPRGTTAHGMVLDLPCEFCYHGRDLAAVAERIFRSLASLTSLARIQCRSDA